MVESSKVTGHCLVYLKELIGLWECTDRRDQELVGSTGARSRARDMQTG